MKFWVSLKIAKTLQKLAQNNDQDVITDEQIWNWFLIFYSSDI